MPFARLLTLNAAVVIAADLTNRSLRVPSVARTSANSWSSQWESCLDFVHLGGVGEDVGELSLNCGWGFSAVGFQPSTLYKS